MGPLPLLLLLAGVGYFVYSRNAAAGWKPAPAKMPLSLAELAPYAKVGIGVKFYLEQPPFAGSAVPSLLCNGDVVSVEMNDKGERFWKIKLLSYADNTTGGVPTALAMPALGTVFALKDSNLSR